MHATDFWATDTRKVWGKSWMHATPFISDLRLQPITLDIHPNKYAPKISHNVSHTHSLLFPPPPHSPPLSVPPPLGHLFVIFVLVELASQSSYHLVKPISLTFGFSFQSEV